MKLTRQRLKEIIEKETRHVIRETHVLESGVNWTYRAWDERTRGHVLERSGVGWNERFFQGGDPNDESSFGSLNTAKVFSDEDQAKATASRSDFHLSVESPPKKESLSEGLDPARREKYIQGVVTKWTEKHNRQPLPDELNKLRIQYGELFDSVLEGETVDQNEDKLLNPEVDLNPNPEPEVDRSWLASRR